MTDQLNIPLVRFCYFKGDKPAIAALVVEYREEEVYTSHKFDMVYVTLKNILVKSDHLAESDITNAFGYRGNPPELFETLADCKKALARYLTDTVNKQQYLLDCAIRTKASTEQEIAAFTY